MAFCFATTLVCTTQTSFIRPLHCRNGRRAHRTSSRRQRAFNAVASENLGKQEEIKELMKKLQELRAKRDELTKQVGEEKPAVSAFDPPKTEPVSPPPVDLSTVEIGRHGEKSRFMSFSTVSGDEYYPRAVVLLPNDATATQVIEAPSMGGAAEQGKLVTSTIPAGFSGRLVSLQFTGKLIDLVDPICVSMPPEDVADNLPKDLESDLVLVIERAIEDEEFDKTKFYLWGVDNKLKVGWAIAKPPQAQCLGRVVCTFLEEPPKRRKAKSAWEEENEVYM